jgi:hypothetical protein
MKRILTGLVAAATLVGVALASSAPAEAYWRGGWHGGGWGWHGGGWGWGLGGFAAGAAVGAALAAPYYPYGYYGYYAPYPYPPPCVWRRVWNGYAWVRACV